MKNFLFSFLIFLLWAFLGMWWYYSCPMCSNYTTDAVNQPPAVVQENTVNENTIQQNNSSATTENATAFNIANEIGADVFNFAGNLQIFSANTNVHIPATSIAFKDSIFSYLNKYQNKELQITGWYKDQEWKENEASDNYGLYRADYLKDVLTDFGINPDKISIAAKKEHYTYSDGVFIGGVQLMFKELNESRLEQVNKGITNKTLYTRFNAREFIPDNTLIGYTADLKNYLKNNPNKLVKITGHTDNVGEESDNQIIGYDRAVNVMNHFINNGIAKEKLQAFSKGENAPIADNATKEGRAKNRRIEININ